MRLSARYALLFWLLLAVPVYANITIDGESVHVETDAYAVRFDKGVIVYIHNKLTDETYTTVEGRRGWSGLLRDPRFGERENISTRRATLVSATRTSPLKAELLFRQGDTEVRLFVSIDRATDDMLIDIEGHSATAGVVGMQWGISYLDIQNLSVIAPVDGGRSFDAATPNNYQLYPYPGGWEAQLAIAQGNRGGFYVRNTDNTLKYKFFIYDHRKGSVALHFGTHNQAPFDSHTTATSQLWRFNTYSGGWRVPARLYRDWMEEAFQVTRLVDKNDWVADLTLFAKSGMSMGLTGYGRLEKFTKVTDRLAELVDPEKTLFHLGGWTTGGSDWWVHQRDIPHPDFIPKAAFGDYLAVLNKHGFRTILYITAQGCSPNHPLYPHFQQYQYRNTWTGELVAQNADPDCRFHPCLALAHISPASSDFRNYVLTQLKAVWDEYDFDGFIIDASHYVMNNAAGLIDGLSTAQGMALLHQEMVEMMPGVILGGERLHEATFVHESFATRPLFGEHPTRHPISSFLFSPFTHIIDGAPGWYEVIPEYYHDVVRYGDVYDMMPGIDISRPDHLEEPFVLGIIERSRSWRGSGGLEPDVNGDGQVNVFDLVIIAQNFGAQPLMNLKADVNGDRRVDVLDLIVVSNWIGEPTVPR